MGTGAGVYVTGMRVCFIGTWGWECRPAVLRENGDGRCVAGEGVSGGRVAGVGVGDRGRGLVTGMRVCFVGTQGWECRPAMLRENGDGRRVAGEEVSGSRVAGVGMYGGRVFMLLLLCFSSNW